MSKAPEHCPICGAGPRGDYIFGANMQWWKCNNNEDLLEYPKLQPDACRIRQLEWLVEQHQTAWTKTRNGLLDAPGGGSDATKWAVALIDHYQPLEVVTDLTECGTW